MLLVEETLNKILRKIEGVMKVCSEPYLEMHSEISYIKNCNIAEREREKRGGGTM